MKHAVLKYPELDVAMLAFFLHFVWEFWQMPLYEGFSSMAHVDGVIICSRATLGDVVISTSAYVATALIAGDRWWARQLTCARVLPYLAIGLVATIGLEWLSTEILDRWQYTDSMPVLPLIGTGIAPILQWIAVPLLLIVGLKEIWFKTN